MADVFVLNYLLNTLEVDGGAERWKKFKAKQLEEMYKKLATKGKTK